MSHQIRVLVGDSQGLFAEALSCALQEHPDLDVSESYAITGRDAVNMVAKDRPDVALIDYWITGLGGPATSRAILNVSPATKVLLLAEYYVGHGERQKAAASGAIEIVRKSVSLDELAAAFRRVATLELSERGTMPDEDVEEVVKRLNTLTWREIEVLQLLRQGFSIAEVSTQLSLSVGTTKNYIHKVFRKTNTTTQLEAINLAEEHGLISPVTRDAL